MAKKKAGKKAKSKPAGKAKSKPAGKKPRAVPKKAAKKAARKPAARASMKKKAPARKAAAPATGPRQSWLDESAQTPIIDRYARELGTFIDAMADGQIDDAELKAQEGRLVALMKEVEPQLDGALHEKVTRLLCEVTAYDIMHMLHAMAQRPAVTEFQG